MAARAHRRRILLFLASILIPAAVFMALGIALYRRQPYPMAQFWFYACAVLFALAVTLFCRYAVWQDYRREAKLAEIRTQFVASVSHELRTPLTGIRACAETLALGRVSDEAKRREYLEMIAGESDKLARLVDNILDYSRMELGTAIHAPRRMDLRDVVTAAMRAVAPALEQQGFEADVDLPETPLEASADADSLQRAMLNLLTNAMKYSGEARRIAVRLHSDGRAATIEVADSGHGIPARYRDRVFEKFFRIPEHGDIPGVGLGLTLVANTMRLHGGRVEIRDNQPRGCTFALILPVA